MSRARRSELAVAALATVLVSFLVVGTLRGGPAAASPVGATELTLLRYAWWIGLCVAFVVIPKSSTPPGVQGASWERRAKFSVRFDWPRPWWRFLMVFLGAAAVYLVAVLACGQPLAAWLVARGIALY